MLKGSHVGSFFFARLWVVRANLADWADCGLHARNMPCHSNEDLKRAAKNGEKSISGRDILFASLLFQESQSTLQFFDLGFQFDVSPDEPFPVSLGPQYPGSDQDAERQEHVNEGIGAPKNLAVIKLGIENSQDSKAKKDKTPDKHKPPCWDEYSEPVLLSTGIDGY
jgi:hypothetical protein